MFGCSRVQLLLVIFSWTQVSEQASHSLQLASQYLTRYGYLADSRAGSGKSSPLLDMGSAIEQFQGFAGLEQTGELDEETLHMMERKRCGVKDIIEDDEDSPRTRLARRRGKRYALQGSRWRVKNLTYKISKYPTKRGLSKREVDDTMRKAFEVWEKETDLKFERRASGKVHIEIRFEKRNHGDDDPFDGEGGTLAHAFFPVFGGDAHFDDDEDWTVNSVRGTSLLMTASHELGHSLGLSHSNVRKSLMAPFYRGYEPNVSLDEDDTEGIQALYGPKTVSNTIEDDINDIVGVRSNFPSSEPPEKPSSTTAPSEVVNNKELCRSNTVDTMVSLKDGVTYAFKGEKYWKLTDTSVEAGYPRAISDDWAGLAGNLDASFTWKNGKTYFFKGSKYWRFSGEGNMDFGYPKEFSKGFSGIPENVDAAFLWPVNNKIYFFKGSKYWKFDPEKNPPVSDTYPRPIANWVGIPNNLDAAIQYSNGKSYFFKDGKYFRFDDRKFEVDTTANPPFPRQTSYWWFGCDAQSVRLTKPEDEDPIYTIDYDNSPFMVSWADFE